MKKTVKLKLILSLVLTLIILACSKDDDSKPAISAEDFTTTIDENPESDTSIGTISAVGTGILTYSITTQVPDGALDINSITGELTVANPSLFDFETNPQIDAVIKILNDDADATKTINATVKLNNIDDIASFLTTSKSEYISANDGDWVEITETEYGNLASKLNEVTTAGLNNSHFIDDLSQLTSSAGNYTTTIKNTLINEVMIESQEYVFAFKYVNTSSQTRTQDVVKISSSSDVTMGYNDLGNPLPSHSGEGVHCFVIKGNNTKNTANGYLAFYFSKPSGFKDLSTLFIGYKGYYETGNTNSFPSNDYNNNVVIYQALTTTQKQWD